MLVEFTVRSKAHVNHSLLLLGALFVVVVLVSGCRLLQTTAEAPGQAVSLVTGGKKEKATVDPVEVEQLLLRVADEFSARMTVGLEKLRRGTNAPEPTEILQWKIAITAQTTSIVSGPNAIANLLDMTVLVSVTRAALEQYWQPKVFGISAQPMLESCQGSETNIWRLANKVLNPAQQVELRAAIDSWYRQNPLPESILGARAVGFASQAAEAKKTDPAKPGSVFNLLMLDPLSGLDPATREIAQTRLFAERALYVAQKMPTLLRWQMELLSLNSTQLPAVQQVVTNSTQIASSVESFAKMADQLPKLVNDQREAAIKQVLEGLATERTNLIANLAADEAKLRETIDQVRQTLDAGTELMKSSDTTINTLNNFIGRFDKPNKKPALVNTNARPFDILDYATTARETAATLKELNGTLNSLDQSLPRVQKASATFEQAGQRLLNRLFVLAAVLLAALISGTLAAALVYRRFTSSPDTHSTAKTVSTVE